MTTARIATLLLGILSGWTACRPRHDVSASRASTAELAAREQRLARKLASSDSTSQHGAPLAKWILPRELREISGLALTSDGRLLAHDDEHGRVTVIDPRRGVLLKRFSLGTRADFEGITVVNRSIYMIASNGVLYEFGEGADGARVRVKLRDTRLGRECEFEGVAYDPGSGSLLLPCKRVGLKQLRDHLVIYRWSLQPSASPRLSMLTIPLALVIGSNGWKSLHPSDITVDPSTGHYVLVASHEKALVEITPSGDVVRSTPLPGNHNQAEGVAITKDGILIVSDEAMNRSAVITLYRWPLTSAALAFQ
jgi:uncharacterized protein YjiK